MSTFEVSGLLYDPNISRDTSITAGVEIDEDHGVHCVWIHDNEGDDLIELPRTQPSDVQWIVDLAPCPDQEDAAYDALVKALIEFGWQVW